MGNIIICRYAMAAKPYEIEKERLKIYSTEELCFYLKHHIYDVDNTIINGKLATWLGEEIGAVHTAGVLNQEIMAKAPVIKMLETILLELDYLSKEEVHKIVFRQALPLTPAEEAENLGNLFLKQDKFENAVKAFRKALRYRRQEKGNEAAESEIYEKIGIAYARLYLYDEAAESFSLSYLKNPRQKVRELYAASVEMGAQKVPVMEEAAAGNPVEYQSARRNLEDAVNDRIYKGFARKMDEIRSWKSSGKEAEYKAALDALIAEIKDISRKQMV